MSRLIYYCPKFLVVLSILVIAAGCTPSTPPKVNAVEIDSLVLDQPTLLYGFQVDSFEVFQSKVRWNESLSDILLKYNINHKVIYALAEKSEGVFDVRKLKAGYPYTIIHEKDTLNTARQFIFEPDPTAYVVFNMADSVFVESIEREVTVEEKVITASINSSVYEAVLDQGASPILVNKLVDVFAWQVDFFRIQKGDEFKVIYEQKRVGDQVIDIGVIKSAFFKHFDKEYYAIYYQQEGNSDYFDENGQSLRKTFLRAPLNYSRISSRYSPRRFHPVQKRYKAHLGTDYAAPTGTPIRTVGDGVVLEARYGKYNGNFVKVKHNSNYTTQYLHMSKIARGIRPGVKVKQGQTIGFVGSTGLARGPHLCFRFWKNGRQVDALKVDLPPTEPINAADLVNFLHEKNIMVYRLNRITPEADRRMIARNDSEYPE